MTAPTKSRVGAGLAGRYWERMRLQTGNGMQLPWILTQDHKQRRRVAGLLAL